LKTQGTLHLRKPTPPPDPDPRAAALAWLRASYPAAFQCHRPLAIGIHHQLHAALPENVTRQGLYRALAHWTRDWAYLRALWTPGAVRVDLQGQPVGLVTETERLHAGEALNQLRERLLAKEAAAGRPKRSTPRRAAPA